MYQGDLGKTPGRRAHLPPNECCFKCVCLRARVWSFPAPGGRRGRGVTLAAPPC